MCVCVDEWNGGREGPSISLPRSRLERDLSVLLPYPSSRGVNITSARVGAMTCCNKTSSRNVGSCRKSAAIYKMTLVIPALHLPSGSKNTP